MAQNITRVGKWVLDLACGPPSIFFFFFSRLFLSFVNIFIYFTGVARKVIMRLVGHTSNISLLYDIARLCVCVRVYVGICVCVGVGGVHGAQTERDPGMGRCAL